jgi:hypothetical protein
MQLDNTKAVAYINKRGGLKSKDLNRLALEIIQWGENKGIYIKAVHLSGSHNFIADQESREHKGCQRLEVIPRNIKKLSEKWQMSIDLFAFAWNTQLKVFVSWLPQTGS